MSDDKVLFRLDMPHGPGTAYLAWQNGGSGTYLATTGNDGTVGIFSRQGQLQERIILQALCSGMAWDCEGDVLGIISSNSSQVTLWDVNTRLKHIIDTGLRDPLTCILWSKTSQILAAATARGNLAIYNHQTSKRTPILGKHSKRITCGAWSKDNILALGSEDKTLSLSSDSGDSFRVVQLRDVPSDMCFAEMKTDERVPGENTVSMVLGKKTLYMYHLPEPDSPAELGFQHKYGALLQHKWFGDGYILLGFAHGYIVAISTHPKEVGQELWQIKNHKDSLAGISVCSTLDQVASCGDNNIKIHSTTNLQETVNILTMPDQNGVQSIDWSSDGQLLAATSVQGSIYVFVTKLQSLYAVSPPRIAVLSSIAEVCIYNYSTDKVRTPLNSVQLEIEPSFIGIGPYYLACGMNNHVWFYDLGRSMTDTPMLLGDREYMAEIKEIKLNAMYCAVLCGGKVMLHAIETQNPVTKDQQPQLFPENVHGMQESVITCLSMTSDFLIFATDLGNLVYFSLEYWSPVINYRHLMGVKSIYTDLEGTKLILIDVHNEGYIFCPASENMIIIPNFPKNCRGILWDVSQPHIFVAFDEKVCITFVYVKHSVNGKHVTKVGETNLLSEQIPLVLCDGELCLNTNTGKLSTITLSTHINSPAIDLDAQLQTLLNLRKFADAWDICKMMNATDNWTMLGNTAISDLDISFAIKVFRSIGNAAKVFALESVQHIEDINYLSGYCALLLDKPDKAKAFFAKSANPLEALELCRDLLQCEQALVLADTLASEQIPFIAREYAQQLEFTGNYAEAIANYEKGLKIDSIDSDPELVNHRKLCQHGIARASIKNGDYRKGINLATNINDKQLLHECGEALIAIGHLPEAAHLFELANSYDDACQLYAQLKAWQKVQAILPNVTSLKLYAVYAKAKENEGKYLEAIESYKVAGEKDNAVRLYLDFLSDPHSAGEIVMETRSVDGSKMLARFYQNIGDYEQSLHFLILCGCITDAFALAKRHNKIRQYGELLDQSENAQPSHYLGVAQYFENEKHTLLAGKYYFMAKEYSKALKHLLKASSFSNDENAAISLAIDCVASSNDDRLANQLIEFLLGEFDGTPKDSKYLFRLYMAKRQYREAAKAAVIISNQEQITGNYRSAHDLLFSMYQELRRNNLSIATDLKINLNLLHRYSLVRIHVKIGDHLQAAKLLVQVAGNISQFPAHVVPILTSTVIECQRAGLQKSAFSFAVMLMRPEYRNQIDPKYSKKIEAIVRKTPRDVKEMDDTQPGESQPCPICNADLPVMDVTCFQCKTTLPICVATGNHISKDNLAACPSCDFPCLKTAMTRILDSTNQCPMCGEIVDSNRLCDIENLSAYL